LHIASDEGSGTQDPVVSHIVQENRRVQFADSLNSPAIPITLSISVSSASINFTSASEAENVCDAARWMSAIHQQEITLSHARREHPIHAVLFVKPMVLASDCHLYPYLKRDAKKSLKFDHFDVARNSVPVVMPTDNAVAFSWVMPVHLEVARLKFKLDSDALLAVAYLPIGDAVRISAADCFDAEL
jgi:hypothetical protein